VDRIRTPLLVIQGANDSRVVQAESDNLIDMYRAVERFLAAHPGGRPGDSANPRG
jgi:dipeptidyl aminopeptidase/acylaminoacyl peptidase